MNDWTVDDKKKLLLALNTHGLSNIQTLAKEFPFKTVSDIRFIIDRYTKLAANKWIQYEKEHFVEEASPLTQWIRVLSANISPNAISDVIPRALKYIALFEKDKSADPEFRKLYMALSELTNGKPPRNWEQVKVPINTEIQRLARKMRTQMNKIQQHKDYVKNIKKVSVSTIRSYKSPRGAKQQINEILNPLAIPNRLLVKINEDDDE